MEFVHLNYEVVDSIAEISLQRPPVNALNLEMIREIVDAVNRAAEDPKVRAVIFASNVPRRFCAGLDLNELFLVGRWALAIGVAVLSFSVIIGQAVLIRVAPQPFAELIAESLLIFGWVANWRPIEIFLYEWWPLVRRRNLYRRLAAAQVELKPFKSRRVGRIPPGD